jgi:AraC-like DNA-binding protein
MAPAEVAAHLGYSDQSHMTRSLKQLLGRTPAQIARAKPL